MITRSSHIIRLSKFQDVPQKNLSLPDIHCQIKISVDGFLFHSGLRNANARWENYLWRNGTLVYKFMEGYPREGRDLIVKALTSFTKRVLKALAMPCLLVVNNSRFQHHLGIPSFLSVYRFYQFIVYTFFSSGKKSKSVFDFLTYSRETGFSYSYEEVQNLHRAIAPSDEIDRSIEFDNSLSFGAKQKSMGQIFFAL